MIHAFHYEPHGQRQRFESREQQGSDLEQRQIHLHLSLHLHLNLVTRVRRAEHAALARVTTIFAAFMGALSMALSLWIQVYARMLPMPGSLSGLAGPLLFAGALLGLGAVLLGGLPLVVSAWRASPRSRFLFLVPILTSLLAMAYYLFVVFLTPLGILGPPFFSILPALLFYGVPFVSTIAITRAIRQATIADTWLRFVTHLSRLVVVGMVLMLVGVVLWGVALALVAPGWFAVLLPSLTFPWHSWLLFALGMLLAVMVALWASFRHMHPPASQPRPHDALPSEVDSSGEPRGYRG